jgi:hypothetical protein
LTGNERDVERWLASRPLSNRDRAAPRDRFRSESRRGTSTSWYARSSSSSARISSPRQADDSLLLAASRRSASACAMSSARSACSSSRRAAGVRRDGTRRPGTGRVRHRKTVLRERSGALVPGAFSITPPSLEMVESNGLLQAPLTDANPPDPPGFVRDRLSHARDDALGEHPSSKRSLRYSRIAIGEDSATTTARYKPDPTGTR